MHHTPESHSAVPGLHLPSCWKHLDILNVLSFQVMIPLPIITQLEAFVNDTNADIDMAYDWVCEQLDISSFVDNEVAWDSFYNAWEACWARENASHAL